MLAACPACLVIAYVLCIGYACLPPPTPHTLPTQALNEDGSADFAEVGPPQLSAEEAQAQAEAAQRLKDRRKANKAKREEKNKSKIELARLAAAAAEEEMEELKEKVGQKLNEQSSEIQLAVGQANDESRKKMGKLKRKYEKKLQASRAEIDDILVCVTCPSVGTDIGSETLSCVPSRIPVRMWHIIYSPHPHTHTHNTGGSFLPALSAAGVPARAGPQRWAVRGDLSVGYDTARGELSRRGGEGVLCPVPCVRCSIY